MEKDELIHKKSALMALTGIFNHPMTVDEYISSCERKMKNIEPVEAIPIDKIKKMKAEINKAYDEAWDVYDAASVLHLTCVLDEIIKKYTGVET